MALPSLPPPRWGLGSAPGRQGTRHQAWDRCRMEYLQERFFVGYNPLLSGTCIYGDLEGDVVFGPFSWKATWFLAPSASGRRRGFWHHGTGASSSITERYLGSGVVRHCVTDGRSQWLLGIAFSALDGSNAHTYDFGRDGLTKPFFLTPYLQFRTSHDRWRR
jgi:hypothetical protein